MALSGTCYECGASVWLTETGDCSSGHARNSVSQIADSEETAPPGSTLANAAKRFGGMIADLKKPKTPEETEARAARDEYEARVAAARTALAEATAPLDCAVAEARTSLASAWAIGTRHIASLAGLALYENYLTASSGSINLETDPVRVMVDTAGNLERTQKMSLGRVAGGALVFGPVGAIVGGLAKKSKTHDARELYILVESDALSLAIPCDPDKGAEARRFVASIMTTSAGAAARAQQRVASVGQWQRYTDDLVIARAKALTGPRAHLGEVRADSARLDAARAATDV